jgi:hypothetical protein
MEISDPRLRSLLRQAERVAESGKRAAAEALYRQVLAEAPEAEKAWQGLASVVADETEKTAVYQRLLEINPNNATALAALNQNEPEPTADWVKAALDKPEPAAVVPEPEPEPVATAVDHHDHAPTKSVSDEFDLVCYRHPNRETALRCYTCNKPICTECAVKTPVGYSCPDCIRDLQKGYYTATFIDYIVAFVVTLPLAILAGYVVGFVGFFIFFIAPVIGTIIGRIAFWSVRRRRGRYLPHLVAGTVVLGAFIKLAAPAIVSIVIGLLLSPEQIQALFASGSTLLALLMSGGGSFIWTGLYAFLAAASAYYFVRV